MLRSTWLKHLGLGACCCAALAIPAASQVANDDIQAERIDCLGLQVVRYRANYVECPSSAHALTDANWEKLRRVNEELSFAIVKICPNKITGDGADIVKKLKKFNTDQELYRSHISSCEMSADLKGSVAVQSSLNDLLRANSDLGSATISQDDIDNAIDLLPVPEHAKNAAKLLNDAASAGGIDPFLEGMFKDKWTHVLASAIEDTTTGPAFSSMASIAKLLPPGINGSTPQERLDAIDLYEHKAPEAATNKIEEMLKKYDNIVK